MTNTMANTLRLTSAAFESGSLIPPKYTCDGDSLINDLSPPLAIAGVPPETKSLALIMDDPDAPGRTWVHWVIYNLPPTVTEIAEGTPPPGIAGVGSSQKSNYQGPCPPSGTHHYFFKLYALDTKLALPPGASKTEVEQAMAGHILDQTELMGNYKRK